MRWNGCFNEEDLLFNYSALFVLVRTDGLRFLR